jgi:uncharacterized protein (DUF433 family)
MQSDYVEVREDNYFIRGSRVSLDSVVCSYLDGDSPETIRDNFPTLSLEQINGVIEYYLANRAAIDAYVGRKFAAYDEARRSQHVSASLRSRLEEYRQRRHQHT